MLELQCGDRVEFQLQKPKKKNKRKSKDIATRIRLKQLDISNCDIRTRIENYLSKIFRLIENSKGRSDDCSARSFQLFQLIVAPKLWGFLAKHISINENEDDSLIEKFLKVITLLNKHVRSLKDNFKMVLISICEQQNMFGVKGALEVFIKNNKEAEIRRATVQEFLLVLSKFIPDKRPVVMRLIKPIVDVGDEATTRFLFCLLQNFSRRNGEGSIYDLEWRDLPLILKKEEIFNNFDLLNDECVLSSVQITGAYDSPEQYLDTYFRLLREDGFSRLRDCIKKLLKGKLGKWMKKR